MEDESIISRDDKNPHRFGYPWIPDRNEVFMEDNKRVWGGFEDLLKNPSQTVTCYCLESR